MAITHSKVSAISDGADTTVVRPTDWNAGHAGFYTARLGADHVVTSVTGTEVMSVDGLVAGTYVFQMFVIVRSATTSVSPLLGVNFTGTETLQNFHFRFADASTSLLAELHTMDDVGVQTFGFISGMAQNAFSTSAPNMGSTATLAVSTITSNILVMIEGVFIATSTGDLELWHSSETATSTSVMAGTSIIVTQTA